MLESLTCEPGVTFSRFVKFIAGNSPRSSNQPERLVR